MQAWELFLLTVESGTGLSRNFSSHLLNFPFSEPRQVCLDLSWLIFVSLLFKASQMANSTA